MVIEKFVDDRTVLEQLADSSCFGVAHNPKARECKMCDLANECWAKSLSNNLNATAKILNPETQAELDKAKAHNKSKKEVKEEKTDEERANYKAEKRKRRKEINKLIGLRTTKTMSTDELWAYLDEVGGECNTYDNERVQRMRLAVAIKEQLIIQYNEANPDNPVEP